MAGKSFGSIRQLKSGRFQARYKYRRREYKAPNTFNTERQAQGWLNGEEKLIAFDEWAPPEERARAAAVQERKNSLTVGAWLTDFHDSLTHGAHAVRRSTMQTYLRNVNNRILHPLPPGDLEPDIIGLKDIPLHKLTKHDVYRWWDAVQRTYDTPPVNQKAYARLKAACAEAARREMIAINPVDVPAAARKVKPKEQYLPEDWELHAIVSEIPERYKLLTVLTLFHGLRIGEAVALELADVKCETPDTPCPLAPRWSVQVRQNAQRISDPGKPTFMFVQPTKTDAGRRAVPIMTEFLPVLFKHLEHHLATTQTQLETWEGARRAKLLTTTATGAMVMDTSYRSVLNGAKKTAGVSDDIHPHSGRRWLITRLAEQGAHVKEIGQIVGDENLETIMQVYMKVRAERTTEMMDAVSATLEGQA